MDWVSAGKSKPGLIQKAESGPQESVDGQAIAAEQNRSEWWRRWTALAVLLLTAILYFAKLGARALWASEFRWAEIAREMLLTHNYFWPTINGRVFFDKP